MDKKQIQVEKDNNGINSNGDNNIIHQTINHYYSSSKSKLQDIWKDIKKFLSFLLIFSVALLLQQIYAWIAQRDSFLITHLDSLDIVLAVFLSLFELVAWVCVIFLPKTLYTPIKDLKSSFSLLGFINAILMWSIVGSMIVASVIFLFINPNLINELINHKSFFIKSTFKGQQWLQDIDETKIEINVEGKSCKTFEITNAELDIKNDDFNRDFKYKNFEANKYYVTNIHEDYKKFDGFEEALQSTISHNEKNIDSVWIFIRGYADTSNAQDKFYPMLKGYEYKTIEYYDYNATKKLYSINPYLVKTKILHNNQFKNDDLPYLRAQFVYKEYFKKLSQTLDTSLKVNFAILKNEPTDIVNSKSRKVETYISFCQTKFSGGGCSQLKETTLK